MTDQEREQTGKKGGFAGSLQGLLFAAGSVLYAAVCLMVLFFSGTAYSYKKSFLLPNILLLAAGAAAAALLVLLLRALGRRLRHKNAYILAATFLLFLVQYGILYHIFFMTQSWDSFIIVDNAAYMAQGNTAEMWHDYFSHYPNNQLLTLLYARFFRIAYAAGLSATEDILFYILVLQCLLASLSGLFLFRTVKDLTGSAVSAWTGWLFFAALIGLSGWNFVAYTDMACLIVPLLILRIYQILLKDGHREVPCWIWISFLSYWGYKLKPTALIVTIAILLEELLELLKKKNRQQALRFLRLLGILAVSMLLWNAVFQALLGSSGLRIDPEKDTGPLHMIMVGLNPASDGGYSVEDVMFSQNIAGKAERTAAQLGVIRQRLRDYGGAGLLQHLYRKLLLVFNDGSFSWGQEGGFFDVVFPSSGRTADLLRSFYYTDGARHGLLLTLQQALWLPLLLGAAGAAVLAKDRFCGTAVLSLLGLLLFEVIFEARARYLILYVPFFVIAGCGVLHTLMKKTEKGDAL